MQPDSTIVLLGAMPAEIDAYRQHLKDEHWHNHRIIIDATGVGKVAAAARTQKLISEYKPSYVLFTGVGGALEASLNIGDVGVGLAAIDADIDVRSWNPEFRRGELPFTREREFLAHSPLVALARSVTNLPLFDAYIASGSAFLNAAQKKQFVKQAGNDLATRINGHNMLPNVIDMESSAIMQVANANNVPSLTIRAVSDTLEGDAAGDFTAFIQKAVDHYVRVVEHIIKNL